MAAIEILGLEKTYMVGFWQKRPKRALQPLSKREKFSASLDPTARGKPRP
jgi:hypothetical protein